MCFRVEPSGLPLLRYMKVKESSRRALELPDLLRQLGTGSRVNFFGRWYCMKIRCASVRAKRSLYVPCAEAGEGVSLVWIGGWWESEGDSVIKTNYSLQPPASFNIPHRFINSQQECTLQTNPCLFLPINPFLYSIAHTHPVPLHCYPPRMANIYFPFR
jgi:hypothetical protein